MHTESQSEGTDHLGDKDKDLRIIKKVNLKQGVRMQITFMYSSTGSSGVLLRTR
jgi:NH3-dependent NAD+ synthetase